jgi:putative NADPH-quinone reductase
VILAHPVKGSFNHALAKTAVEQLEGNGHKVFLHDLYKENFDPILLHSKIPKRAPLPEEI